MRHMKKNYIFGLVFVLLLIPGVVSAGSTYVINSKASGNKCTIKTQANEQGSYVVPGVIHYLDPNDQVTLVDGVSKVKSTNSKCSSDYYYVSYVGNKGYVCGDYINFNAITKYNEEFKKAGFPESYWNALNALKEAHPNWKFTAYNTGLDWNNAIASESSVEYNSNSGKWWSRSYIQSTNSVYLSKSEGSYNTSTKKFNSLEAGGWYAANKQTVGYYMDPRNFLNDRDIYMFESGFYNKNKQTKSAMTAMFQGNAHYPYVDNFVEAATAGGNNISPTMIGARSRLEVGGSKLSASANGSKGYYNFYNIGALSSCSNPVACGSEWAKGKGWTTARASIIGGAAFIYNSYVNRQQKTIYFHKFNTTTNGLRYSNQYMSNIQAPKSEANIIYSAYLNSGLLDAATEFFIPVYNNMPASAVSLPTQEEQAPTNNTSTPSNTNTQTSSATAISTLITKAGYKYSSNYLTNISIGTTASTMISKMKSAGATVTIKTTDTSGTTKTISSSEKLGTGDIITISNGNNSGQYRVVINGDTNGDGKITSLDYVKVKNHIMKKKMLTGSYEVSADTNKDGKITSLDYVKIKNHIIGKKSL